MSDALLDRYAAVERLYSQGQWEQVLQASNALLAELPPEPGDPWRARVLLLQGHTHLYGLAQFERAAAIYQQVLDGRPEPVLQNVATQELARCQQALEAMTAPSQPTQAAPQANPQATAAIAEAPLKAPSPLSQEFPFTAQAMGSAPADQGVSAMPWLDVLGGVDPAAAQVQTAAPTPEPEPKAEAVETIEREPEGAASPAAEPQPEPPAEVAFSLDAPSDVIDEPDQVEVRQADPRSAELIDLEPIHTPEPAQAAAPPRWSPAEEAELAKGLLTVVLG